MNGTDVPEPMGNQEFKLWKTSFLGADVSVLAATPADLRRALVDSKRALWALTECRASEVAQILDLMAETLFDSLNDRSVQSEVADIVGSMPTSFSELVHPERDDDARRMVGEAIIRFWDKALGALSPEERLLEPSLAESFRQALVIQATSTEPSLSESARLGLRRLGGTPSEAGL